MSRVLLAALALLAASPADETWDVTKPRGRVRAIDFSVSEGTKMSADISPDGHFVVFDLLANVYRVPAQGGAAECLTQDSGIALNYAPRYAPDGSAIAFVSDRGGQDNLWLMDADGRNPRALFADDSTCVAEPTWTPDSRFVVARVQKDCHRGYGTSAGFRLYHRDGGDGIDLLTREGASGPSVSPDGRYLYFQDLLCKSVPDGHADVLQGCQQIMRMDLETGQLEEITRGQHGQQSRESSGGALAPQLSPDGRQLAYARRVPDGTVSFKGHRYGPRTALVVRDLVGGRERLLMDPIEIDVAEQPTFAPRVLPGYAWARDGRSLVLSQGGKLRRVWLEDGRVETVPFTARVRRTISERAAAGFRIDDALFEARFLRWHTASPDGTRLAFQAVGRIWIVDHAGGTPRRLTPPSFEPLELAPAWSPDGRSLAMTTWDDVEGGHLWTVPAEGGAPQRLTAVAGEYLNPVFSPEGREVLVVRGTGESLRGRTWRSNPHYELVRVPATGGDATLVTRVPVSDDREEAPVPSFGPGGRIFFPEVKDSDDTTTTTALVSVHADGSDRRTHATFPYATEAAPSPDGRHVAFVQGDHVYVSPLPWPGTGKTPASIDPGAQALPVKRVSGSEGGMFLRWRDAATLEFGSGPKYFRHALGADTTEATAVRLVVPQRVPAGSLALTGARIVTLDAGRVIESGTLVARGGRIACLGECPTAGVDRVIDASGKTIIPGFVDMHAHHHWEHAGVIPRRNFESAAYLAYGVTATLDPNAPSQNVFTTAELIEAGVVAGPRTFTTGGALDGAGDSAHVNALDSYATTVEEVARRAGWGATSLKSYMQPRRQQRQWIVEAARAKGLAVTGEAGGLEYTLSMVMDGQTGWEHDLLWPPIYADVARFIGAARAVYSATFVVSTPGPWAEEYFYQSQDVFRDPKQRRFLPWRMLLPHTRRRMLRPVTDYGFPLYAQAMADVIAAGGSGAIGGHGQQHGLGSHWEVWAAATALGPMGALEVASLHGARFLGAERDIGSLAVGKLADLMVLNRNPLEDIRATTDIQYVMKGGILYDGPTLDEVWPESRPLCPCPWIDESALRSDDVPVDRWDSRP